MLFVWFIACIVPALFYIYVISKFRPTSYTFLWLGNSMCFVPAARDESCWDDFCRSWCSQLRILKMNVKCANRKDFIIYSQPESCLFANITSILSRICGIKQATCIIKLSSPGTKPLSPKPKNHVQWEHHQSYMLHHNQNASIQCRQIQCRRTKCRSPMLKRTWWNSLALFLIVNL